MKPAKWKTLKTGVLYKTPIFDLHRRRAAHPRRGERDFFILDAPDWVNIVPLTRDRRVVMIRQWRHGIAGFTLEIPGGMIDSTDRSPARAARREMIEETGFDSTAVSELGRVHPNPAYQGNLCYSFLARNVRRIGEPQWTPSEETETVLVPLAEIKRLIASRAITHALTIAAFSFLQVYNPPPGRKR